MNPLTKVLRTLRRTSTAWSIIIDPDPRTCMVQSPIGRPGVNVYRLNLYSGIYLDRFLYDFVTCGGASNITFPIPPKPIQSGWVKILDTKLKNEQGQTVQQVLVEILDKFPDYDLETKKGAEVAIRDIESKLVGMASFEEAEKKVANVAHNVGSS